MLTLAIIAIAIGGLLVVLALIESTIDATLLRVRGAIILYAPQAKPLLVDFEQDRQRARNKTKVYLTIGLLVLAAGVGGIITLT